MPQNGKIHFKKLAAFTARFLSMPDHFGTLYIKGLRQEQTDNWDKFLWKSVFKKFT